MHQLKKIEKDWDEDIKEIIAGEGKLEEKTENLIREMTMFLNEVIIDIRQHLIELGFEDNPDHLSHHIIRDPQNESKDYWIHRRWKIYLGKTIKVILLVDLCGDKDERKIPNRICLTMPNKWPRREYQDYRWGVSTQNLYDLFYSWLEMINNKIRVKNLSELKIKLSLT